MTRKGYKFRIYPTPEQETHLKRTIGCTRKVYNLMLHDRIELYKQLKENLVSEEEYSKLLKKITPASYKTEYPYLDDVPAQALANAWTDLNSAYSNFFKRVKKGDKKVGFPKFKSKNKNKRTFKTSSVNGNVYITKNSLKLPTMSEIRMVKHRNVTGVIKSATITHARSGKWFASILVDEGNTNHSLPKTGNSIGIDLGLTDYLITSDGEFFDNPRFGKNAKKELAKEQRKLSRRFEAAKKRAKDNGENLDLDACKNYQKQKLKVARVHEKVANKREDFLHKLSTVIVKNHDMIALESLMVENLMKNHKLAFAIQDASWSAFAKMLTYKSEKYGRELVQVGTFYPSSQICHKCSHRSGKKPLHVREWVCPSCYSTLDRDVNAAINILNEGTRLLNINKTAGTAGLAGVMNPVNGVLTRSKTKTSKNSKQGASRKKSQVVVVK